MYYKENSHQTRADLEKVQDIVEQRLYELRCASRYAIVSKSSLMVLLLIIKLATWTVSIAPE